LLRIARNAAVDRIQVDGRRQDRVRLDAEELLGQLVGDVDVVTTRHYLDGVAGALRSLPPDQRDTLMAAAYYGFSAREISDAWGVPLGTVKTRLRLALHKLRELCAGAST
jgi:RNA polymerase sigma-70 factor (ECF subfamily)